jgi:hypothetical protein
VLSELNGGYVLGDVRVCKDITRHGRCDYRGRHSRVGAADPKDLNGSIRYVKAANNVRACDETRGTPWAFGDE